MTFPARLLDDIRSRISLVELIGQDVALRRVGREYEALCPFHSEKSASFTVVDAKGFYWCFGCGANGDAFQYLVARGRSFPEAVVELAGRVGIEVDGRMPDRPLAPIVNRLSPEDAAAEGADAIERARETWARAVAGKGTLVETYLRDGRGLDLDLIGGVPPALRFIDRLEYWHDRRVVWCGPAMVAPLVLPDRSLVGIHRTWLRSDGSGKLDLVVGGKRLKAKKMAGRGESLGAVIPLAPRARRMQGGEGIETTLSGWCAVPQLPAVCLGSLGNFSGDAEGRGAAWWWPELRDFTWLEDADGKRPDDMARRVDRGLRRLVRAGILARRAKPPAGMDMNDLYRQGA